VERRTLCIWKQRGCKKNNVVVGSVKSREEGREFTEVRNEEGKALKLMVSNSLSVSSLILSSLYLLLHDCCRFIDVVICDHLFIQFEFCGL
jgi:hypothetical protein